ncbi:hypothetical protein ACN28E_03470 [Archangium lansingense]|uniref:hypothetical protein n=1 Tax=Archangium lansingense TaxID=2995310 RepID=UPI003B792688
MSRLVKCLPLQEKRALRADFERFAELPGLVRLIISNEKVAHRAEAASALRQAAPHP